MRLNFGMCEKIEQVQSSIEDSSLSIFSLPRFWYHFSHVGLISHFEVEVSSQLSLIWWLTTECWKEMKIWQINKQECLLVKLRETNEIRWESSWAAIQRLDSLSLSLCIRISLISFQAINKWRGTNYSMGYIITFDMKGQENIFFPYFLILSCLILSFLDHEREREKEASWQFIRSLILFIFMAY